MTQKEKTFYNKPYLEVSTNIGCPVQCTKYCPQEVTEEKYQSRPKLLTPSLFKNCLDNLPRNAGVCFSGFSEPFANHHCIDLIEMAYSRGHELAVFTTLYCVTSEDVKRLIKMRYSVFCLHLPDGKVMKEPKADNSVYRDNVFTVLQSVSNVCFAIMNDSFTSNDREYVSRGLLPQARKLGYCWKFAAPQPVMLPDGTVYLCCMDMALDHKIGNMTTDKFIDICSRIQKKKFWLCNYCSLNTPYVRHLAQNTTNIIRSKLNWRK